MVIHVVNTRFINIERAAESSAAIGSLQPALQRGDGGLDNAVVGANDYLVTSRGVVSHIVAGESSSSARGWMVFISLIVLALLQSRH